MPIMTAGAIETAALAALRGQSVPEALAGKIAWACAWLESVGYPGLAMLAEALETTPENARYPALSPEYGLVDTQHVSCVFIAPQLSDLAVQHSRIVLLQARHGLYCLPFSVAGNFGIGCPVDPSFALGGPREKNPYLEKLAKSAETGVEVAEEVLSRLAQLS